MFDGSQQWLLWIGCGGSYDPHGQDVARAMAQILDAAGVSWGVLARETCCGEPARRAGNEYLYMELSQQVIESFRDKKVKQAADLRPALHADVRRRTTVRTRRSRSWASRSRHHTEFLGELLPRLELRAEPQRITYHDPCYLARGRGITAEPRQILRQIGAEIVEMEHHAKHTFCCGAGGAQLFIPDDKVELPGGRVNQRRFAEVEASGALTVAVACPYCPIMLKDAAQHARREDIQVLDVAELVAARLS